MIRPRDLTSDIYRGGRRPLDLYRRVTAGIQATPMPAFIAVPEEDRWHIVNYVLSIPVDGAFFDEHGQQYHGRVRLFETHKHDSHDHDHDHDKPTPSTTTTPSESPARDSED